MIGPKADEAFALSPPSPLLETVSGSPAGAAVGWEHHPVATLDESGEFLTEGFQMFLEQTGDMRVQQRPPDSFDLLICN